jgi:hypothetical protein
MTRILIILALISSTSIAGPQAFVINNLAETVSRIDLTDGTIQNHITTVGDTPNQIAYSGGYLYVLNSISANLQRIDPETHQIVFDMPLTIGSNPYKMALDSSYDYITCLVSGGVDRIDLNSGQPHGEIVLGGYPEGILIYGNHLYVAQTGFNPIDYSYGQGKMAIIDIDSFSLEREINVGKNPQAIFIAPDGRLHIVCTGNYSNVTGRIYIFNLSSNTVEDSILIGGQPAMGVVGPNGIAYLAAGGWVDHGNIFSYNTTTGQIVHGPSNPILSGIGVVSLAIDSLGFIYSCDFNGDTVTKLNFDGEIIATYAVGDGPQSMVILDDRIEGTHDQAVTGLPNTPYLIGNYPNPFNSETIIEYWTAQGAQDGAIVIYNITGQEVKRLKLGTFGDVWSVIWNGRDKNGANCSSGLYLARLEIDAGEPAGSILASSLKLLYIK